MAESLLKKTVKNNKEADPKEDLHYHLLNKDVVPLKKEFQAGRQKLNWEEKLLLVKLQP